MMTRRLMQTTETPFNSQRGWGVVTAMLVAVLLLVLIIQTWPAERYPQAPEQSAELLRGSVAQLGQALVSPDLYVLPFEVASVLLLAALIGSIVIARPEKDS